MKSTLFFSFRYLFLLALIFLHPTVYSQKQPSHEKKVYVDENEKMFWNKKLPVYIRLSASADDAAPSYLMKSDTSAKYTNPYYFDTEGYNFIRTRWAVDKNTGKTIEPKTEVLWEVYADGIAPTSDIQFTNDKVAIINNLKYCGKNIGIQFTAKDKVSGVENIYYSINNKEYQEYKNSLSLTDEGEYSITFYSVDKVGNAEEVKSQKFVLDASSPTTTMSFVGNHKEEILSGKAQIILSSIDGLSGPSSTTFSLDNSKEIAYLTPINLSQLAEGEHTFKYYSTDKVNNKEPEKEYTFYVDKSAPLVTLDVLGDRYNTNGKEYFSGRAKVKLIAIDNKAGVSEIFYSLNKSEFKKYDEPFYLTGNGNTRIDFYAIDNIGNKSQVFVNHNDKSLGAYVDLTGPTLTANFLGATFKTRDTVFISPETKIKLKATDTEAGVQKITYSINGREEIEYNEPISIAEEGYYTLDYFGYDNVNNSNKQAITFVVDTSGPKIFPTFDGNSLTTKQLEGGLTQVYPSHVALFLSVTDKQLGYDRIYYSINGGPETLYTNPLHGFGKGKDYKIKVKALDKLGNSSVEQLSFAIAE